MQQLNIPLRVGCIPLKRTKKQQNIYVWVITRFQVQFGLDTKLNYHVITNSHFEIGEFSQYQYLFDQGLLKSGKKTKFYISFCNRNRLRASSHEPGWTGWLGFIFTQHQKDFGFPCTPSTVKMPDTYSFLAFVSSCLIFFNCSILGPLSLSLSDLLAALYNLCFFLHSLLWALLNQGRLQRLDEVSDGNIFLSCRVNAFSSSFIYGLLMFLLDLTCSSFILSMIKLSS